MLNGKSVSSVPSLKLPAPGTVLRLLNAPASKECLAVGFLDKSGRGSDCLNRCLSSYVLVMVLRGNGTYVDSEGKTYSVAAGQAFQRFPWISHSNYIDKDSKWFECYLSCGPLLYQTLNSMMFLPGAEPILNMPLNQDLIARLENYRNDLRSATADAMPSMVGRMLELLSDCQRLAKAAVGTRQEEVIRKAVELLGKDFSQPVALDHFCRSNAWSYEKFRKVFQRATGMPPCRFRVVRRLEAAVSMLQNPALKVKSIAGALGYSSSYDFSLQFKKYFGVSPQNYRRHGLY